MTTITTPEGEQWEEHFLVVEDRQIPEGILIDSPLTDELPTIEQARQALSILKKAHPQARCIRVSMVV